MRQRVGETSTTGKEINHSVGVTGGVHADSRESIRAVENRRQKRREEKLLERGYGDTSGTATRHGLSVTPSPAEREQDEA